MHWADVKVMLSAVEGREQRGQEFEMPVHTMLHIRAEKSAGAEAGERRGPLDFKCCRRPSGRA